MRSSIVAWSSEVISENLLLFWPCCCCCCCCWWWWWWWWWRWSTDVMSSWAAVLTRNDRGIIKAFNFCYTPEISGDAGVARQVNSTDIQVDVSTLVSYHDCLFISRLALWCVTMMIADDVLCQLTCVTLTWMSFGVNTAVGASIVGGRHVFLAMSRLDRWHDWQQQRPIGTRRQLALTRCPLRFHLTAANHTRRQLQIRVTLARSLLYTISRRRFSWVLYVIKLLCQRCHWLIYTVIELYHLVIIFEQVFLILFYF